MSDSRSIRSEETLREASGHLHYEMNMLVGMAYVLAVDVLGEGVLRNAVLESFTIHVRNLLHFMFPARETDSDVLAEDYLESRDAWEKLRGDLPELLKPVRRRVNKEVVHLTYDRLDIVDEAKGWKHQEIADAILRVLRRFAENVDADRLAPGTRSPGRTCRRRADV